MARWAEASANVDGVEVTEFNERMEAALLRCAIADETQAAYLATSRHYVHLREVVGMTDDERDVEIANYIDASAADWGEYVTSYVRSIFFDVPAGWPWESGARDPRHARGE